MFEFDGEGHVTGVRHEEQTESHRLIEALMVLANEQVAGYLEDRKLPTLYRVHERPEPRSVEFLADQLASLDIPTPPLPKNMTPQQAADAAAEMSRIVAREAPDRRAIGVLVLRALKQAYYTPRNLGHAGLASPRYTHFTSPIRRYPGRGGAPRAAPGPRHRPHRHARRRSSTSSGCTPRRSSARRCRSSARPTTCASPSCSSAAWRRPVPASSRPSRARWWG